MVKPMVGYLVNKKGGAEGEPGAAYDFIMAENGVFLAAETPTIRARIRVGEAEIRGLEPLTERVQLIHGGLPSYLLAQVLQRMRQDPAREVYAAVADTSEIYSLHFPQQEGLTTAVRYHPVANTIVDFHSHGHLPAHFSKTDDADDQGFRISVVIGLLQEREAEMSMRVGIYGYHATVNYLEVFTGPLPAGLVMAQARSSVR